MAPKQKRVLSGGSCVVSGATLAADVVIDGDRIGDVLASPPGGSGTAADGPGFDASGLFCVPGFLDLQVNGAFGHDLASDPTAIDLVSTRLPEHGVVGWLPTLISSPIATRQAFLDAVSTASSLVGAVPLGCHLEGPVLNEVRHGAHSAEHLAGADALLTELTSALAGGAPISMVTLAPEMPQALELVAALHESGVLVSAGHSNATATEFRRGLDAGISYVTHLFNALRPFHHRDPGIVGAALTDHRVTAGLIVDGVHLSDEATLMAWRLLGPDRISLVSDATALLDADHGAHQLGNAQIQADGADVRNADGVLAGARVSLPQTLANLARITGATVAAVVGTVTETPARLLGLNDRGRLVAGARSDLAVIDADFSVCATIIGGELRWLDPAHAWRATGWK